MYVASESGRFRPWEIKDGFVGTDALRFAQLENVMRKDPSVEAEDGWHRGYPVSKKVTLAIV